MPRDGAIFGDLRVISVADDGVCPLAEFLDIAGQIKSDAPTYGQTVSTVH